MAALSHAAALFEAPLSSPEHASLRDTAWMGGALVEGRYLLGRLLRRNFFLLDDDDFQVALQQYFCASISAEVAEILSTCCLELGVLCLRYHCRDLIDIPSLRNEHE